MTPPPPPFTATSSPGHKPRDVLGPRNEAPTGLLQVSPSARVCSSPQILPISLLTQVLFEKENVWIIELCRPEGNRIIENERRRRQNITTVFFFYSE